MKTTDIDLRRMLKYEPDAGRVMLGPDRMLIFRVKAMQILRALLYEQLGPNLARALLSQFGYKCGAGDYANLTESYDWDEDIDRLASGPVLHTWEGIVRATPTRIDYDRDRGHFDMAGEWANSYEAAIHLEQFGLADAPVCHSLTGYASGWGSVFFGAPVICIESTCVGRGDDLCRFEIRDAQSWGPEADPWKDALKATRASMFSDLEALSRQQREAIDELSTPILEVWDDVLVLPIVGVVDRRRSADAMARLLEAVTLKQARCVIIDITGVDVVDTRTADDLVKLVEGAGLLGAWCVVTGVSAAVAQTLVEIGADLSRLTTLRDLKQGLRACIRYLHGASPT
ncbi:MAG: XylR N-terminal domain-containing protein [Myxococcales bacterium]|nr:XylR N-terminal domain-containing protein [Myxococcales bacterium]